LPPTQTLAAGAGERSAVLVTGVADGGPAATAGLRGGDILLAADGHDLHDAADLEERVLVLAPGQALTLSVWRAGQLLSLALTIPVGVP
jgi:serine protease Do